MDTSEISKTLQELKQALKPLKSVPAKTQTVIEEPKKKKKEALPTPEQVIAAAGPPPFEPVPAAQPVECINVQFKKLLSSLSEDFIGQNNAKAIVLEIISTMEECKV